MASTITTSIVTGGSNSHATTSAEANQVATDFVTQGVVGTIANTAGVAPNTGAFAVNAQGTPAMFVDVTAGNAYITATPSGQVSQVLSVRMTTTYTSYAISANSSGSTKYDYIYLKVDATKANNPASDASDVTSLYTSRSSSNTTDNGSPPTYGILLAVVTVANGASSITNANIADRRSNAYIASTQTASSGWTTIPATLSYNANNGNKEFVISTSSDITSQVSVGMKVSVTRGTVPPTQSMAFASASSQSASKASPSGITFTGNWTAEAWIFLQSYPSATTAIIGRDSAGGSGSGWEMGIDSSGRLYATSRNGSGSTVFNTYQAVPLNRWFHVAAVTTIATPTVAFYFNGLSTAGTSTATAATSVVQASTNLALGKGNNTTGYFNGYMSEVRLWSAAQTQANIQANMAINLTGSESNLVALFEGNGNFNDSTSNANNLTANSGAIATQASNPYNATEYGEVIATSSTTLTLRAAHGCTFPNLTYTSPQFSTQAAPYGWPGISNILAEAILCAAATATSLAAVLALSVTANIPAKTRIRVYATTYKVSNGTTAHAYEMSIWDGSVSSGTELANCAEISDTGADPHQMKPETPVITIPTSGSKTYNVGLANDGTGTVTLTATTSAPAYLAIERV